MTDAFSTLVLGGARSGKSRLAEDLAARSGLQQVYIATAQTWDDEMRQRVAAHIERRGNAWTTIEEPFELAQALKTSCRQIISASPINQITSAILEREILPSQPIPFWIFPETMRII